MAAILIGVPHAYSLHASAANAVTYSLKYVPKDNVWRFQDNTSVFDDNAYSRELYYLQFVLKEGDLIVVYNDCSDSVPSLDLGTTHLSNLTVTNMASFVVIYSGDIDDCYLLGGASCAINANIANAYIYDTVLCNFNKNVGELNLYARENLTSTIGSIGTVNHVLATYQDTGKALFSLYNFPAGSFALENGTLTTDKSKYSITPNAVVKPTITAENFDYVRYANDYPDVKAAFGLNAAALYKHYTNYGIKEKELPTPK